MTQLSPQTNAIPNLCVVPDEPVPVSPPSSSDPGPEGEAWSVLYRRHYPAVYRQVRHLCGDQALAEDLTQETFLQAMASRDRYDGRRAFVRWTYGIALNVVRRHWRRNRTHTRTLERYEHAVSGKVAGQPDGQHMQREQTRALHDVLDEIPSRWREAFVLREVQGLATDEVAERLGITGSNVAVRVMRARKRIRKKLVRRGWIDRGGPHALRRSMVRRGPPTVTASARRITAMRPVPPERGGPQFPPATRIAG
ncbi:MAG: sigma-70 family RNA polymerase sigma factor [Myxococcota bacterium]